MAAVRKDGGRVMFSAGIIGGAGDSSRGEKIYENATSEYWTCPPGVTSVCVVLVGWGGAELKGNQSVSRSSGGGGALVYKNDIPVTPGATYLAQISTTGTSMFGMTAGAGSQAMDGAATPQPGGVASSAGSPTGAYNGGAGMRISAPNLDASGGGAGTYTAAGTAGSGRGISLYGNTTSFGLHGAGGSNYNLEPSEPRGAGAIRIIWGAGRSFPNNAA